MNPVNAILSSCSHTSTASYVSPQRYTRERNYISVIPLLLGKECEVRRDEVRRGEVRGDEVR